MLLDALTPWGWVPLANGAALLAASGLYLGRITGGGRWFAWALAAGSAALALATQIRLADVLAAATNGGQVLGFLLLVEVLGVALQTGRYDAGLTGLLARGTPGGASRLRAASIGCFVLNLCGLFMGAVPAAFYALGGKPGRADLPLAIAATRGFGASALINPVSPLVLLALAGSHASLSAYLASAVPVAMLLLVLDGVLRGRQEPEPATPLPAAARQPWLRAQTLGCAAAVLAAAPIYHVAGVYGVAVLPRIGLAVCAGGLGLGLAAPVRFATRLRALPRERFLSHRGAVPFFTLGALFGTLLVGSRVLDPLLAALSRLHMPLLEFPLIVALIVGFRWLGLAPVISLLILGPLFAPAVSLSPTVYALALTFGGVAGFLGSPLSGTNLFVASVSGVSPFHIALHIQGRYVATAVAITSVYAMGLTRWLG
ncbi:MAG TPA: hypothetical protein VK997_13120 [Deferrisomatales bacterium]|nr:hypothetical protein [Deferrisomatales bacterium]